MSRRPVLSTFLALCALLAAGLPASSARSACVSPEPGAPRTLVLALDGVPYRVLQAARERGAFKDWPEAIPLVSTFPSVTNIAFTALFEPFGVEPAEGYEVRHFDRQLNRVVGGGLRGYGERLYAWRDTFDVTGRTVRGKLALYTRPLRHSRRQLDRAELALLESERDLVLAHVGATDALLHLRGDAAALDFVLEVDRALGDLRERHLRQRGRPLRLIVLSDHGNTRQKVRPLRGVRPGLRKAGLRPVDRLRLPGDVVAKTFGVVGFGALFTDPEHAPAAARAVAALPGVDLAAWAEDADRVRVVSAEGQASVLRRALGGGHDYAYRAAVGDPLRFEAVNARLEAEGALDADGYGPAHAWLAASVDADFPDALRRLTQALHGDHLTNPAAVIFSTTPGRAWGLRSAHVSSKLAGGRLEGTHGGLDRESSLAFFLTDDAELLHAGTLDLEAALASLTDLGRCVNRENADLAPDAP